MLVHLRVLSLRAAMVTVVALVAAAVVMMTVAAVAVTAAAAAVVPAVNPAELAVVAVDAVHRDKKRQSNGCW